MCFANHFALQILVSLNAYEFLAGSDKSTVISRHRAATCETFYKESGRILFAHIFSAGWNLFAAHVISGHLISEHYIESLPDVDGEILYCQLSLYRIIRLQIRRRELHGDSTQYLGSARAVVLS